MSAPCPEEDVLLALASGEAIDPEMRCHADECEACRQRLTGLREGLGTLQSIWQGEAISPVSVAAPSIDRPATIGKYFIVGVLREDANAVVYRGLHATLNKEVVLELGKQPVEEVERGNILALLDHPNLARILGIDFHDGRPCLVGEYVTGTPLEEVVVEGRPAPLEAVAWVARLARALGAAHARGVVHHGVKPGNVLITDDKEPILIGLGLPWLVSTDRSPTNDLVGLAGVLFFLLTSEDDPQRLDRPDIPARIAALCKQALASSPASAEAFAADLEALLSPPLIPGRTVRLLLVVTAVGLGALTAWLWAWFH